MALRQAAAKGSSGAVKEILESGDVDPNATDSYGYTPLMEAVQNSHASVVALLLADKRVDPNIRIHNGNASLFFAAAAGNVEVIRVLLAHTSIEPNSQNTKGRTALKVAAFNQHREALELLLADDRIHRVRPPSYAEDSCLVYDLALRRVKSRRKAAFRGLIRAIIVLWRMRLRAATRAYAPGGKGFKAVSGHFEASRTQEYHRKNKTDG